MLYIALDEQMKRMNFYGQKYSGKFAGLKNELLQEIERLKKAGNEKCGR